MMLIDNKFELGQTVYVRTDQFQHKHIITQIQIIPAGGLIYVCSNGSMNCEYYDFELSAEKDMVAATSQ